MRCWECGRSMRSTRKGDKKIMYFGNRGVLCYKCGKKDKNSRMEP